MLKRIFSLILITVVIMLGILIIPKYSHADGISFKNADPFLVLNGDKNSLTGPDNNVMWGIARSHPIWLEQGNHILKVEMAKDWGLIDYLEILEEGNYQAQHLEAESNFMVLNDMGSKGKVNVRKEFSLDSNDCVSLPDTKDVISLTFYVPFTGNYTLSLREKAGWTTLFPEAYWKSTSYNYSLDGDPIGLEYIKKEAFGNPVWVDFNNDGNLDMVVPHHTFDPAFYQNDSDGTFINIFSETGITSSRQIDKHGFAWGDYDNDGNIDLFIAVGSSSGSVEAISQLWKGDGKGHFVNVTEQAGITGTKQGRRTANWVDYNNDGYLDLFILWETGVMLYKNNGYGTFSDITQYAGLGAVDGIYKQSSSFADYDNDGDMDLFIGGGDTAQLLRNNGDSTFTKINFIGSSKHRIEGIAWGDYDYDGDMDLFVSRGVNDNYRNVLWDESKITFSNAIFNYESPQGLDFKTTGNQVTFYLGINNNFSPSNIFIGDNKINPTTTPFSLEHAEGEPSYIPGQEKGFFIWKDEATNTWHMRWSNNSGRVNFYGEITSNGNFSEVTPTFISINTNHKSTLYRNNGNGSFSDVTEQAGVGQIGNYFGAAWGDYDNDGDIDLYVVDSGDISGNKPNLLYKNNGDGTFTEKARDEGIAATEAVGSHYGAAWGDYDNNGFLDLFLSQGRGWGYPFAHGISMLYKNLGNYNNWIKLKLVGRMSNRSGIGVRVILDTPKGIQTRQLNGQGGELYSQGLTPIHFGVGNVEVIDSIAIVWPSGFEQTLHSVPVNQTLTIIEADDVYTEDHSIPYWYVKFDGSPAFADASNKIAGDYSIGTVRNGSGAVAMQLRFPKKVAFDPSNTSLNFHAYSEDFNDKIQFIRFHAPNWENRFTYYFDPKLPLNDGEWTKIKLDLSQFIPEAGSPDWNNISLMTINFYGGKGPKHINIDQLYFDTIKP